MGLDPRTPVGPHGWGAHRERKPAGRIEPFSEDLASAGASLTGSTLRQGLGNI